tara:strand:- start:5414 stop:7201 length:1788 start_codon:yes stop_codon:yes gene_type:complete
MRHKILPFIDFALIHICFLFCSFLLEINPYQPSGALIFSLVFIVCCKFAGFYKIAVRYIGLSSLKISLFSAFVALFSLLLADGTDLVGLYVFSALTSVSVVVCLRIAIREYYFLNRHTNSSNALVYGAGSAGVQYFTASLQGDKTNIIGFIDDSTNLVGSSIHGRKVYSSSQIKELVPRYNIKLIVIAMPILDAIAKRSIINELVKLPIRVVTVPTLEAILDQTARISDIQDISFEDLLGRDIVPVDTKLIDKRISGKTILVTGAGGSIGSEICHQISKLDAKQLILLDISEPALFEIQQALIKITDVKLTCILGSVLDSTLLRKAFQKYSIDAVFHAAAYKHVPLVEDNQLSALINNVFGTKAILDAAVEANCRSFTLISTDKAVRPTNIMGSTKRLAELVCQATSEVSNTTVISMVRFGNVLGSSGSVIPTFKNQIENNGPVTITHRDITRYFMTIPEAAQLVIQSSGMAEGGDVFILDMGEPVKIYDMAKRLIRLSGKNYYEAGEVRPDDLAIKLEFTGLRPGEKLYEELLIDASALTTVHPKIMRAKERFIGKNDLENYLERMKISLIDDDFELFYSLLDETKIGYARMKH